MREQLVETAIKDLKPGDIIVLQDGRGKVMKIAESSHMPSIFQDCFGKDGRSVHWLNLDGPYKGKTGAERVHADTTVNKVVELANEEAK